jgi:hypothetical protein
MMQKSNSAEKYDTTMCKCTASQENVAWSVSLHAKVRAYERYGIKFSQRKWADFCSTMRKEKFSIRLENDASGNCRFACYFQGKWFLVGCSLHGNTGIIATFLPPDSLTDSDRSILRFDDRYERIGNDCWYLMNQSFHVEAVARKRRVLPDIPILPEELPPDFEVADALLDKEIDL